MTWWVRVVSGDGFKIKDSWMTEGALGKEIVSATLASSTNRQIIFVKRNIVYMEELKE